MTKRDDAGDQPTKRMYRSSDVHKRRVGDSARPKPAKMPSKREVRESERESLRINTESLSDRPRQVAKSSDASETPLDQHAVSVADERPGASELEVGNSDKTEAFTATSSSAQTARLGFFKGGRSSDKAHIDRPHFTAVASGTASQADGPEAHAAHDERGASESPDVAIPDSDASGESDVAKTRKMPAVLASFGQPKEARPSARRVTDGAQAKRSRIRPATLVAAIVALILIAGAVFFAYDRWGRYDDYADMQGTWYVLGTETPVVIDGDTIRLNDDVAYRYEINTREKTITYTFGPMQGQGRYWFSSDRKHLVITDGDDFTAASTTFDDLLHAFLDFSTATGGGVVELPQGKGIIAFSRTPEPIIANQPAEGLVVQQGASSGASSPGSSSSASASAASAEAADPAAVDGQETGEGQVGNDQAHEQTIGDEQPVYDQPAYDEPAYDESEGGEPPYVEEDGYDENYDQYYEEPEVSEEEAA